MEDVERNESGNESITEQEKPDAAHLNDTHYSPPGHPLSVDEVVDDLANDVTDTGNEDKPSGQSGLS